MNLSFKKYSLAILCVLASAQSSYPMAGSNSWMHSVKNSLSGFYRNAVSYCTLQKAKATADSSIETVKNNPKISAVVAAATGASALAAWTGINWYTHRERISKAPWMSTLKKVPGKLIQPAIPLYGKDMEAYGAQKENWEDDLQTYIIPKEIPINLNSPHSVVHYFKYALGNPAAIIYARNVRMKKADDCIVTNGILDNETQIKHAGLSIINRSRFTSENQELMRFTWNQKKQPVKKIIVAGMATDVNEMIVWQKDKHLTNPAVYVTLKDRDQAILQKSTVDFGIDGHALYIHIPSDVFNDCVHHYDVELHLPQSMKLPEIKYTKQQVKPALLQVKY